MLTNSASPKERFTAEEDQQIVELKTSGMEWQVIGSRLQRTKATCARRYALLKEKAQLAGRESPSATSVSNRLQVLTHTSYVTQKICRPSHNHRKL